MAEKPDFQTTFEQLKGILQEFEPRLDVQTDGPGHYYLNAAYSEKFKRVMFFGAVEIKKNYVSYYLMPVYIFPELLEGISESLKKRMHGKSCFNFKTIDGQALAELSQLTRRGFEKFDQERLV